MFEPISQIPFHFTTSLCSLMDPIYYIYHKFYHICGDHVGHCHRHVCVCTEWHGRTGERCLPFRSHFFCHLQQIKSSQSQPATARWQRRLYDGPINFTPLLYFQTTRLCVKHHICTQKLDKKIDRALLEMCSAATFPTLR